MNGKVGAHSRSSNPDRSPSTSFPNPRTIRIAVTAFMAEVVITFLRSISCIIFIRDTEYLSREADDALSLSAIHISSSIWMRYRCISTNTCRSLVSLGFLNKAAMDSDFVDRGCFDIVDRWPAHFSSELVFWAAIFFSSSWRFNFSADLRTGSLPFLVDFYKEKQKKDMNERTSKLSETARYRLRTVCT